MCKKEGFISAEGEAIFLYSPLTLWRNVRRQMLHTYKSGWTLRGMSNGALFIHTSQVEHWEGCPMVHCSYIQVRLNVERDVQWCIFQSQVTLTVPSMHGIILGYTSPTHTPCTTLAVQDYPGTPPSPTNLVRVWQCKSFILGPSNPVSNYSWRPELQSYPGTVTCSLA